MKYFTKPDGQTGQTAGKPGRSHSSYNLCILSSQAIFQLTGKIMD